MRGRRTGGTSETRNGCDQIKPLLEAFHDGGLSEADTLAVRRHLRECERCSARLSSFGQIDRLLREAPRPVPPQGLRARLYARIAGTQTQPHEPRPNCIDDASCVDHRSVEVS